MKKACSGVFDLLIFRFVDLGLKGQVGFVTAASRGIGLCIAKSLVEEGCKVAICGRDEERLREAVALLEAHGKAVGIRADLAKEGEPEMFVSKAVEALGVPQILVVNTGYPRPALFVETTDEDFDEAYRILLRPVQALLRAVVPQMAQRGYGRVLAIGSIAIKAPLEKLVLSNSIRPGVAGLIKTLAKEMGRRGVLFNMVCPGFHKTERLLRLAEEQARREGRSAEEILKRMAEAVPVGRLGDPEDLGRFCAFLVSPVCNYLNGALIQVDGGLYEGLV